MSWMERIFNKPAAAPAPAQVATTQTNDPSKMQQHQQTAQTAQTDANGIVPAGSAGQSPIEQLAELWKTAPVDPNAPQAPEPITAEKIMEAAGKVDFTKVISQEDLAKIQAGGAESTSALVNVLNRMAQTSYGHSAFAATKLVEQAVSQAESRFAEKLPTFINSQNTKNTLLQDNPAFANPAVAPFVEMMQQNIAAKFPNATPAEAAKMAKDMMAAAGQVFNPAAPIDPAANKKAQSENWDNYLTS